MGSMAMPPGRDARCPRCGAPLAWDGFAANAQCGYCQTVVPMRAPAPAPPPLQRVPLQQASGHSPLVFLLPLLGLAGVAAVGIFISFLGRAVSSGGAASVGVLGTATGGATVAEITKADLATTPEQLAKRFGVAVYKNTNVYVNLSGARFASIGFFWDQSHLEHVNSIALIALPSGIPPDVLDRAKAQLGRALHPASTGGHQFSSDGVGFSIGGSTVNANVHKQEDPRWKARMAAMFTLLKGAGLGTSDALDERTKRDVLNIGYPLTRLNEVNIGVTVDGAEREVHRVIPGAVSAAERHDVGLGHAWFDDAMLLWANEAGGKFTGVNLYFAPTFDFKAQREDVERCLKPVLGAPKVIISDHLAGVVTLTFDSDRKMPYVHVTHQLAIVQPAKEGDAKASLAKLLSAIAACG